MFINFTKIQGKITLEDLVDLAVAIIGTDNKADIKAVADLKEDVLEHKEVIIKSTVEALSFSVLILHVFVRIWPNFLERVRIRSRRRKFLFIFPNALKAWYTSWRRSLRMYADICI
jgi:hypothetical protein